MMANSNYLYKKTGSSHFNCFVFKEISQVLVYKLENNVVVVTYKAGTEKFNRSFADIMALTSDYAWP